MERTEIRCGHANHPPHPECGRFAISPDTIHPNLFSLSIAAPESHARELGKYCSINDAILAVSRQETGHSIWDNLDLNSIPYKVHDITCWDFGAFF